MWVWRKNTRRRIINRAAGRAATAIAAYGYQKSMVGGQKAPCLDALREKNSLKQLTGGGVNLRYAKLRGMTWPQGRLYDQKQRKGKGAPPLRGGKKKNADKPVSG